ncbi:MAG: choice-of-anchor I family protein [Flavipsychrobacter sp.]
MKKVLLLASGFLATVFVANAQTPSVSFGTKMMTATEGDNVIKIPVIIKNKNVNEPTTVFFQPLGGRSTAGQGFGADVQLTTQSLTFFKNSSDTLYAELLINDDNRLEITEYFMLQISNVLKGTIGADDAATIFIKDNDYKGPIARKNLELELLSSFTVGTPGSSAEVIAYDTATNRLYVVNSEKNILHILNFNNPASLSQLTQLDMSSYGGGIQSVAAYNGLIAVAVQANSKQDSGKVVFFAADGNKKKEVTVGALPDMVTYTPNGRYLLVANEGEPNSKYTNDPEGSIAIIDLDNGVANATVSFATFTKFNSQAATLKQAGVRIFGANNPTVAQDIEPEYIAVNATSDTAWVSLQENNAIAVVLIASASVEAIYPLGTIDHNQLGKGLDASDKSGEPLIANWPVNGMFMPDGIASYTVNGQSYVLTANEGDAREYDPLEEEEKVSKLKLDPTVFPHAKVIQEDENLGRLKVTKTMGDIDNDGDYDKLYSFGTRSFSIFNANNFNLVYDSGDDFENIINADPELRKIFNASNSKNDLKDRSDNKGPEPEAVTVGVINDSAYAFVVLERIGGVMAYDITNPNKPVFVDYLNTRIVDSFGGDNGAEVVLFIHRDNNLHKKHLLITANEVSGTVAVFEVKAYLPPSTVSIKDIYAGEKLTVYPNPADNILNFGKAITGILYDNTGRIVKNFVDTKSLNVQDLTSGMYFLQVEDYQVEKVIIQ